MTSLPNKFSEDDLTRFTAALNFIATEAKFGNGEPKISYMIEARNHFAYLQSVLGKIEANIAEIKKVTQVKPAADKEPSEAKAQTARKPKATK